MSNDDTLFDTTPYGGPPRQPHKRDLSPKTPDVVAVSGPLWNGASKTTPGLMHYVVGQGEVRRNGVTTLAIVAACGIVVVPHTFESNEMRLGCTVCVERSKGLHVA